MNLIALLLGLLVERAATRVLHLRELRWMDPYFDAVFRLIQRVPAGFAYVAAALAVLLPVLPVLGLALAFRDVLNGLLYIAFAAPVLAFSLGPRDLGEEVDEYSDAVTRGDEEAVGHLERALTEGEAQAEPGRRALAVEEAVLVRANSRIFGVIFWFMVLGPSGAWLFRVTDLMRRRGVFEAGRARTAGDPEPEYLIVSQTLFGLAAWIPARLLAIGYAMAGSFEDAVSDWKKYYETCSDKFFHVNDEILACSGRGAIRERFDASSQLQPVHEAMRLVKRTLLIWLTAIALLTVLGQVG
jgi:membrane protein required for beta-lactamase induction